MTLFLCSLIGWKAGSIAKLRGSKMAFHGQTNNSNSFEIRRLIPLSVNRTFLARGNPPTGFTLEAIRRTYAQTALQTRKAKTNTHNYLRVLWPVNERRTSITRPHPKSQASLPRARTWLTLIINQRPVSTEHARAEFKQKRSLEILFRRTMIWSTSSTRRIVPIRTHFTARTKRCWLYWRIALKWSQWTCKLKSTSWRTLYFLDTVFFTESSDISLLYRTGFLTGSLVGINWTAAVEPCLSFFGREQG